MQASGKLLLIDGHSILNRAFYGMPDLTNSTGVHVGAVAGFLNIFFKIYTDENPDHLGVAFDLSAPTFRHEKYKEYKGTRSPMDPALKEQVPLIKELLLKMGIAVVTKEGFEADDILGTLAKQGEREGLKVIVLSGDKDLFQLAGDNTCIRIPRTKKGETTIEDFYAADVLRTYQVTPSEFIDVKALMGDTSDNIPGVAGIGEKTAIKIIAQYHSIEEAIKHVDDEKKPSKVMQNFKEQYETAVFSKWLATIKTDVELPISVDGLKNPLIYTGEACDYALSLGLKKIAQKLEAGIKDLGPAPVPVQKRVIEIKEIIEASEKREYIDALSGNVSFCIEKADDVKKLTICDGALNAVCFEADDDLLLSFIKKLCTSDVTAFTFGLKDQLYALPDVDILPEDRKSFNDLSIAAYLINPLTGEYGYSDIMNVYGAMEVSTDSAAVAAAYVHESVMEKLSSLGLSKLYDKIELPLVFVLYDMEKAGIYTDSAELADYSGQLKKEISRLECEIYGEAGEMFNINSPKQLGEVLFERMGLPHGKKTKTGYSTAVDVLERLAPEYPVVSKILEYRTLSKLKSTYADGLTAFIGEDSRIHTSFNQTITATGRLSSTDPNLQNIPIRTEQGRQIRRVFKSVPGKIFIDADYSQVELRILAHMSGDENLIKAYNESADIHRMTAAWVFGVEPSEVTDIQRRNAKAVNFGIVYGISTFGLSEDLSVSREEAKQYIESYFKSFPGVKKYLDGCVSEAKEKGYVTTLYGRIRPIPELKSSNFNMRSFGERVAMNSPIQGTAADIMKLAMIRIHDRLISEKLPAKMLVQVHDEVLIEADESVTDRIYEILEQEMTGAAELAVKLEVDIHKGHTWYEAK